MTDSFSFMTEISDTAEDILKQEMMINAIDDTKQSYAVAKATIQQRQWHLVTGELASNFLVSLKVVLETLAYSGFILIAILVMLPTGLSILNKYLQILIWLQLWAPLYAVLNMVMSSVAMYQSQRILAGEGLNMLTSIGLSGLHADIEAIAAMCSASIPFISYSLIQGGVGSFMNLAGTMTSAMSGSAQGSSSEITSGNLAMNTVSYGGRSQLNTTGFKYDTSLSYKSGKMEMERLDGSQSIMSGSGNLGIVAGAGYNTSKLPDNMSVNHMINSSLGNSINHERSVAANYNKSYEQHRSKAFNHSVDLLASMSRNRGENKGWQTSDSSRHAESINATTNFVKQLQENEGYSEKQASEVAASIGFRIPGTGIGASTNFSSSEARDHALQKGKALAETKGLTEQLEAGVSHLHEVRYNESKNEENRIAKNIRDEKSEAEKDLLQSNLHNATADKWQETKNMAESLGIGVTEDATEKFISFVADSSDLQGEKFGRAKALDVVATRAGDYGTLLQKFADKVANERLSNLPISNAMRQGKMEQSTMYDNLKNLTESQFSQNTQQIKINEIKRPDMKMPDTGDEFKINTSVVQEVKKSLKGAHYKIDARKGELSGEKVDLENKFKKAESRVPLSEIEARKNNESDTSSNN